MYNNVVEALKRRGFDVVGTCEHSNEVYLGVKMPELVFTLNSIEAFEANFPLETFEEKFKLTLAHLTEADYDFCRNAGVKPIIALRKKGLLGFIKRLLNKHKPIYLCRDSVWLPQSTENLLDLLETLKHWYSVRSPKKRT
ncbi:MAG: hypothetical protein QW701_01095 [Candidatus Nezhaarchaeales archaeon]